MELNVIFKVGASLISGVYKEYDKKEDLQAYLQSNGWNPVCILTNPELEEILEDNPQLAELLKEGNESTRKRNKGR